MGFPKINIDPNYSSYNYHGVTPQSTQPFSIDGEGFPCKDPAISSPRSFHEVKICSVAKLKSSKGLTLSNLYTFGAFWGALHECFGLSGQSCCRRMDQTKVVISSNFFPAVTPTTAPSSGGRCNHHWRAGSWHRITDRKFGQWTRHWYWPCRFLGNGFWKATHWSNRTPDFCGKISFFFLNDPPKPMWNSVLLDIFCLNLCCFGLTNFCFSVFCYNI